MLTQEWKQEMEQKKEAVEEIATAIKRGNHRIINCEYIAFQSPRGAVSEWIKISFKGNGYCTRNVTCNSISGLLLEIAKLMNGGYYNENEYFQQQSKFNRII